MQRFWDKVDKSGDCWEWTGYKTSDGYGRLFVDGKAVRAHRFVMEIEGVDIPSGMIVGHACDNPSCVKPDHLWIGTQKDNVRDMARKGRHGHSKLTKADKDEIRRLKPTHTLKELGGQFGVCFQMISRICNGC